MICLYPMCPVCLYSPTGMIAGPAYGGLVLIIFLESQRVSIVGLGTCQFLEFNRVFVYSSGGGGRENQIFDLCDYGNSNSQSKRY